MERNVTEVVFGAYRLAVDVEGTRGYYRAHPLPWVCCDCAGCRNFVRAVKTLPPAVTDFFAALGLDPEKPAEVYAIDQEEDAALCRYGAFYHLRGELLAGLPEPGCCCGAWLALDGGTEAAFRPDCALVPADFPAPRVQLEAAFCLPWLLEEENPYYHNG